MLFGGHLRPFSGFKETVDLYPLFWCTFSQISWFLMIFGHFNRKWTFWTTFEDLTTSSPKNPVILTNFDHFGPLWGSWREAAARPLTSCLWAEGPTQSLSNPCPDLKFWSFWPLFLLKKSIFVILPIRGQWKCHFDPILTSFEPSWAQLFGPWPKCAYLYPLAGRTLEGPSGTLNLTWFWPFWTPLRVLEGGCG